MIYLDHAATSFPKPPSVVDAVTHWFRELGVSADRGDGQRSAAVAAIVEDTRRRLAQMCGVPPARVAFTSGATESLNLFLRGHLQPGARVLTTAIEHSSVVRPLVALREERRLHVQTVPCDGDGRVDEDRVGTELASGSFDLLVFSHASNVTGAVVDAASLCAQARANGCASLVDACQTAGVLALDLGADAVAASAHKSLLGPPGLGFLAVRPGLALRTVKHGGTGSSHALERHPDDWPNAMQAGTPNTPAICGLHAALVWLEGHDRDAALARGLASVDRLRQALEDRRGVRCCGPLGAAPRLPILSFTVADLDPAEIGVLLAEAEVHVRTGYHCAPWIHAALGTAAGGTVRVSPGPFNAADDTLQVARALPA